MPSRPFGKGHSGLICVARSLLGRKTRGGGGAGTGARRAERARNVPPRRGERTQAGKVVPAGAGREGSGPRAAPGGCGRGGGARVPGVRSPGAGTRRPRGRACAALPPTPRPRRPRRRQLPARRARRRAGHKTRAGAGADGVGAARRPRAEPEKPRRPRGRAPRSVGRLSGIPHLPRAQVCGPRGPCEVPIGPGRNCVQAGHSPSTVARSPKIYNRPKPFLEKSYFPGFRETVITSILQLEGNVHPFHGRKKNVQSRPILGNTGNGVGPVPGVHPLVPSPEHT